MKALKEGLFVVAMVFISSMSTAQDQKQTEKKEVEPVKVNEVVQLKKTYPKKQGKKLLRLERIQKVGKEEKQ
jgi:hypothetical protein